jgi:hypothetical protein
MLCCCACSPKPRRILQPFSFSQSYFASKARRVFSRCLLFYIRCVESIQLVTMAKMKAQPVEPARMTEQGRRMSSFIKFNPEGSAAMEKKGNSGGIKDVLGGRGGASEFSLPLDVDDNDDARSTNSTSTPEQSTVTNQRNLEPEIAARENAQVFYSKLLVMSVLLLSAGGVGFLTWWFIAGEEEDDYKAQVSIYSMYYLYYVMCVRSFEMTHNSCSVLLLYCFSSRTMQKNSLMCPMLKEETSWLS